MSIYIHDRFQRDALEIEPTSTWDSGALEIHPITADEQRSVRRCQKEKEKEAEEANGVRRRGGETNSVWGEIKQGRETNKRGEARKRMRSRERGCETAGRESAKRSQGKRKK
ncbi:hypothetical protein C8J57DRAFT_1216749 [Mycena rebaudengoi]|nr:hypothetical protein C8J57DRAFT_1216749 [Mycena rebaudengoi]